MGLYDEFGNNENLERDGVEIEYDTVRVKLARAGGTNARYAKVLEAVTKPYRRAMETGSLSNEKGRDLLCVVMAKALIRDWETKVPDGEGGHEWKRGVEQPDGSLGDFNEENVVAALVALPDLYSDLNSMSNRVSLYREALLEGDAGN